MQSAPFAFRSRRGCMACRRDHVKCDERRPVCNRCHCKKMTCDYGTRLIWPDESQERGVRHGRGAEPTLYITAAGSFRGRPRTSSASTNLCGKYFLNTSVADLDEHRYCAPDAARNDIMTERSPLLLQRRSLTSTRPYDEKLMGFYDRILCGTATVENDAKGNPFRALLIPLALESDAIMNALQAISARSIALNKPHYRSSALWYYTGAINGLVRMIDELAAETSCASTSLFQACVLCMLLCWFEICSDTNGKWINHLIGLLHLLGRSRETGMVPSFITNYVWYHFVVARTVLNVEHMEAVVKSYISARRARPERISGLSQGAAHSHCPPSSADVRTNLLSGDASEITEILLQWMEPVDLHEINTYPGLSSGLLLLINQIVDLEYLSSARQIAEHSRRTNDIKTLLENHRQYASKGLQPTTLSQVCASGEAYRLAALLFLHHKTTSIRMRVYVRTTASMSLFSDHQICDLVSLLVAQLENEPSLPRTMANPLWPLFIAACSTDDDYLRVRILTLFSQIESHQRFCNVPQVRKIIERIWRHCDLCADEQFSAVKKYNKSPFKVPRPDESIYCNWDRIVQLMTNFTWSLT